MYVCTVGLVGSMGLLPSSFVHFPSGAGPDHDNVKRSLRMLFCHANSVVLMPDLFICTTGVESNRMPQLAHSHELT